MADPGVRHRRSRSRVRDRDKDGGEVSRTYPPRSPGRRKADHLRDWRNWAVIPVALAMAALLVFATASSTKSSSATAERRRVADEAAKVRAELVVQIATLEGRVAALGSTAGDNREEIGRLQAQVEALQEQLRLLGQQPVVPAPTTTTTRPQPTSTTTATSTSSSTTTTTRCLVRANRRCIAP